MRFLEASCRWLCLSWVQTKAVLLEVVFHTRAGGSHSEQGRTILVEGLVAVDLDAVLNWNATPVCVLHSTLTCSELFSLRASLQTLSKRMPQKPHGCEATTCALPLLLLVLLVLLLAVAGAALRLQDVEGRVRQ